MIIQCEKCQTRFRLDDSRVTDKGVKVRCTKCKHVFTVQKEVSTEELFEPMAGATDFFFAGGQGEAPVATSENHKLSVESKAETVFDSSLFEDTALKSESIDFSSFSSDEDYAPAGENEPETAGEPAAKGGEVDFSSFDFGDSAPDPDVTPASTLSAADFGVTTTEPAAPAPRKEASQGLDFSDDDMFGAVVQTTPEESSKTITFDFEGDSFAESMSGQDFSSKSSPLYSLDTSGDTPFNLGEIDFGVDLTSVAVQQVNPDDLKPSHEILFAPLAEAEEKAADDYLTRAFLEEKTSDDQQELPPLSIASRRKQSPLFGILIAVAAILVISVLGYFGYSSFSDQKVSATPESGRIGVRDVKSAFIENDQAGELLVISGEALNEFPKSRAALQVKVTVFDAAGQSVATKIAYCGNPLTDEQLESMPLDKIEATMANQFGDSLANMEVSPGKAIPFVVVLANLPDGAKDFGVQSSGSTVATGKQQ